MSEESTRLQGDARVSDKAYELAEYLWQHPDDLIDASRLFHRFQVSVEEFQQALVLLEV